MSPVDYSTLALSLAAIVPESRVFTDPLRTLAYGTDASFYRLTPKIVAVAEDEIEVAAFIKLCRAFDAPLTFRAAGTSLSGQAVTDSVLVVLGEGFGGFAYDAASQVARLGPALVGGEANRRLLPFSPQDRSRSRLHRRRQDRRHRRQQLLRHVLRRGPELLPHAGVDAADAGRRRRARHRRSRQRCGFSRHA